jgi:phosphomannomutase
MPKSAHELMVSISGVRGIVGDSLTPEVVRRYVEAFGAVLKPHASVALGRDSRTSGPWVTDLASAVMRACGHDVTDVGLCGTPTLGYVIRNIRADAGIMVTASHNAVAWNALKFLGPDGGFVKPAFARKIYATVNRSAGRLVDYRRPGSLVHNGDLRNKHLQSVLKLVPPSRKKLGLKVVLDVVNGAGSVLTPEFLERHGCRVKVIFGDPTGLFAHAPEPLPKNLKDLCREVVRSRADFGIAVDPDVDRVAFVDHNGRAIGEELSLGLAAAYVLGWRPGPVVVNLSTSRVCQDLARTFGQRFYRTKVGEAHVAAKMHSVNAAIGGEGNGGVMYPRLHPGRDALVGIAFLLGLMRQRRSTLAELVAELPTWHLERFAASRPKDYDRRLQQFLKAVPGGKVDRRDGIRVDWPHGWVQMRKSNTEPVVRILAEARTPREAKVLVSETRQRLRL